MFNLIKYELRGKLLTIFGICITVIMGNLFLMTKISSWEVGASVLSIFLGSGALVLICISSLTLMSDYLYDDQGYLLFTLPQSGVSIMASRLIAAVAQISIVTIVSLLMFCLLDQGRLLNAILQHFELHEILYSILMHFWTIVSGLTFIYFCMVVGKIALKGKKLGKIGSFIIFFLLSIAKAGLTFVVSNSFPQIVELHSATNMTMNIGSNIFDIAINSSPNQLGGMTMNIGSTIFDMVTFAILFMVTSYLLEHKVDL